MIKNTRLKLLVLCIGVALAIFRERDYYQLHGRVSDGIIGTGILFGVVAVVCFVYWMVWVSRRKAGKPRKLA